jgi:hypothetical protein
MYSAFTRGACGVALVACIAGPAAAQPVQTASVTGAVFDPGGAPLSNAHVTATHLARSQSFRTVTDAAGRFRFPFLPVGAWRITITRDGFRPLSRELELAVGESVELPVTLPIAGLEESVAVVGTIEAVELTRTAVSERVTPREIDQLPLNGRNYLDLALLTPGVSRTVTRNTERFAETSAVPGTGLSVAGQRNVNNTFVVDGLSANDDAAGLAGTFYSQEVIREFQVITSGGAAEFGRASAGAVNIITQSGTNAWQGRGYSYVRDEKFDARNAFATGRDPLSQVQFGGTIGGPIRRERTFIFANAEGTRQDRTGFRSISAANIASIQAALDQAGYRGPRPGTGPFPTGFDTVNAFVRGDHRVSPTHLLAARYSLYDIQSDNARNVGGLNDVSRGTALSNRDQTAALNSLATWGTAVNDLRAQVARSRLAAPANDTIGPAVNIAGVASFGVATFSPERRDLDVVELADTVSVQRGAHLVKAGVDLLYNRLDVGFPGALPGVYGFASLANMRDGVYTTYQQAFGDANQAQENLNTGVFVQDEWRAHPDVTLTAGLRYDVQDLDDPIQTDWNNLSPRVGLAWAPGSRRTILRGSAGLYFDRIPLRAVSNALQRDGVKYRVAVIPFGLSGAPVFPQTLDRFPEGLLTAITTIDHRIQSGMSRQASFQVEHQLAPRISVTAAYLALRGSNIIMSRNVNVPTLSAAEAARQGVPNLGRPDLRFANISRFESIGRSQYDGLTVSLQSRGHRWGELRGSYTLSRAMDDAGNAFFSSPQDSHDVRADWGPSDNDQRHRVSLSGLTSVRGWMFSWVYAYASAAPFTVQTGGDRNNDTNANDRPSGVSRNSERGFDAATLDVRIGRRFGIGGAGLEVSVDAFNVLNRTNLLFPNNTFGPGTTPLPAFGRATAAGDPRQVQLGLRVDF